LANLVTVKGPANHIFEKNQWERCGFVVLVMLLRHFEINVNVKKIKEKTSIKNGTVTEDTGEK
jgi:hypothetical protein